MAGPPLAYDQIVFSGGGLRCFWQGGFMDAVHPALSAPPARVSGVSGGALSGAAFLAEREETLLETMQEAFRKQEGNLALHRLDEREALTPHQKIYREVVEAVFDAEARRKVAEGPSFQVLLAHPPIDGAWRKVSGTVAVMIYEAELHAVSRPHFDWAERCGVRTSFVNANAAAREGELTDLICAAACIPPLFDLAQWHGRPVVDGGMADQAPMPEPDEGRTLVLLTRRYRRKPRVEGRLYVEPSRETAADKIDFTDPGKIGAAWDQGLADGRAFLKGREARG